MKTKNKTTLNTHIENTGSNPTGLEGNYPKTEADFDRALALAGARRITPVERVYFSASELPFEQIVEDIGTATKRGLTYQFTFTPLETPKFVCAKHMKDLTGDSICLSLPVKPCSEDHIKVMPFSGILVINGLIVVAAGTPDDTARCMLNVCEGVWRGKIPSLVGSNG